LPVSGIRISGYWIINIPNDTGFTEIARRMNIIEIYETKIVKMYRVNNRDSKKASKQANI